MKHIYLTDITGKQHEFFCKDIVYDFMLCKIPIVQFVDDGKIVATFFIERIAGWEVRNDSV